MGVPLTAPELRSQEFRFPPILQGSWQSLAFYNQLIGMNNVLAALLVSFRISSEDTRITIPYSREIRIIAAVQ